MDEELRNLIEAKFKVPVIEGEDKTCTLQEAVRKHIKKDMVINLSTYGALTHQLIREFWGQDPKFTIITQALFSHLLALVHGRLAKKVLTSFAGNGYPSTSPNPVVQKAYLSKEVEFENWTMRTIPQRLLAGAMGWGFIPTKSILGSSMAEENKDSFKVMEDPFVPGESIGLLKALRPDVTLLHAVAADRCGNTLMTYPLGGDAYGAWASKGVIVSAEKIVSTETIRQYSHLVRVPSYMVLAVCEAPYGSHPSGMTRCGWPEFEAYFSDYDFFIETNEVSLDEERFSQWIKEWILDCPDHKAFLAKIGETKLRYLKGKALSDAWIKETEIEAARVDFQKPANPSERLVAAAGKVITDKCLTQDYKTMLAGVGMSNLAAWLAAYALKEKGLLVDLMAEIGMVGYLPRPSDPNVFSHHNLHNCRMLTNMDTTLGLLVGGVSNRCLGVLGAGQIDRFGNGNSTKIPGQAYIIGSGGANDIANTNQETVVVMHSGRMRLVEKVPYITFSGRKVRTLVTDVGVFEKPEGRESFVLTAYIPAQPHQTEAECMAAIKERVGWKLDSAPAPIRMEPTTREEITLLRLFDPRGYFIGS